MALESHAAVNVSPATPTSRDVITIRLENTFGAESHATSASITQVGNSFNIQQNAEIACSLPSNPLVTSQFQVGPLPPGNYDISATINFTGIGPVPCSAAPITQTSAFAVTAVVPTLELPLLMLLAIAIVAIAAFWLR